MYFYTYPLRKVIKYVKQERNEASKEARCFSRVFRNLNPDDTDFKRNMMY